MWEHYCPVEKSLMSVGKGEECNWCGMKETDEKVGNSGIATRIEQKREREMTNQDFAMVLEGITQNIAGHIVAQVGKDPSQEMVYVFIRAEAGGSYVQRIGICSCCQEIKKDWTLFDSWEGLEDRLKEAKEQAGKLWLLELVARGMCERSTPYH